MCTCCHVCIRCLAAESRSVKAINCSWCSERWTQEDSYPSSPYFMVRLHHVQHSEGIHHSAMGDLSLWSLENNPACTSVCQGICMANGVYVYVTSHVMSPLSMVYVCVQSMGLIEATCQIAIIQTYSNSNLHSQAYTYLPWGYQTHCQSWGCQ